MTRLYKADKICNQLQDKLGSIKEMRVHSIFENALNLTYNDNLVTIIPHGKPLYPNSILLADNVNFIKDMELRQDMLATVDNENLFIAEETISLCGAEAKGLHVGTLTLREPQNLDKRLAVIKDIVIAKAQGEGISPLIDENVKDNIYTSFLKPRIEGLLTEISLGNTYKVLLLTEGIAGCGMGLTPSSDDFLCGLMAVLLGDAITKNTYTTTEKLTKEMSVRAIYKTGFISGAFLKSSGSGYFSEDSLELIAEIYSNKDLQRLKNAALNVARFGATSGTDILCGIYLTLKAIYNYK